MTDQVNHPSHYNAGKYEVIDVLDDWLPDQPYEWQVVKYVARARHKGREVQDLEKAAWYLARLISKLKKKAKKKKKRDKKAKKDRER